MCQKFLGRPSLPRRDVELPRRDVKITSLCHVATWNYTSRRQIYISLSRRNVDLHVATSFLTPLCHVATWMYTSRRGCTGRDVNWYRSLSRRDVAPHVATSFGHVLCHVATCRDVVLFTLCDVATSPRTSRRDPVFSPRMVHFGPSPYTPPLIETLAPLRPSLHQTCRGSHPTDRRPSTAHRPPVFLFESPSSADFGS